MFHLFADLMREWVEPDHAVFVEQVAVLARASYLSLVDEVRLLGARRLPVGLGLIQTRLSNRVRYNGYGDAARCRGGQWE